MDYKKKYNEALKLAREKRDIASQNGADITVKFLEEIFPELCESDDENMFNRIIESLVCFRGKVMSEGDELLAKLVNKEIQWMLKCKESLYITETCKEKADFFTDKQKEQKLMEWSEVEEKLLNSIIDDYEKAAKSFCGYDGKIGLLKAIRDGEYNLLKPVARTEEDEDFINMLILHFNYLIDKGGDSVETYKSYKEKLESFCKDKNR